MRRSFLLMILVTALILFTACGPDPFTIGTVTTSRDIGEDYAPVDPADEFPQGTSIIYVSVEVNNMTPEDMLTVTWNYLETGDQINSSDFSPEETGSGYIGFNVKVDQGFPKGSYTAELFVNDELYETLEFTVK